MGLAKLVAEKTGQKTNPRAVAEQIKAKLDLGDMAQEITIAGPGFINVRLSPSMAGPAAPVDRRRSTRLGIETSRPSADASSSIIPAPTSPSRCTSAICAARSSATPSAGCSNFRATTSSAKTTSATGERSSAGWCWRCGMPRWPSILARWTCSKTLAAELREKGQHDQAVHQGGRAAPTVHHGGPRRDERLRAVSDGTSARSLAARTTLQLRQRADRRTAAAQERVPHSVHGNRKLEELPDWSPRSSRIPTDPGNQQEMIAWEQARRITLETCNEIYRRLGVQLAGLTSSPSRSCAANRSTTICLAMLLTELSRRASRAIRRRRRRAGSRLRNPPDHPES